jgi:predicted transposase YbfD/YdcC
MDVRSNVTEDWYDIHLFVQMYEEKMTERRAILLQNIAKSEQNTFESKSYWRKDDYKKLMDQRNGVSNSTDVIAS